MELTTLQTAAKAAFEKKIAEKAKFLSDRLWSGDFYAKNQLEEANGLIQAAATLGAVNPSEVRTLTEAEIEEMVPTLSALRALDMKTEAYAVVYAALTKCGIPSLASV